MRMESRVRCCIESVSTFLHRIVEQLDLFKGYSTWLWRKYTQHKQPPGTPTYFHHSVLLYTLAYMSIPLSVDHNLLHAHINIHYGNRYHSDQDHRVGCSLETGNLENICNHLKEKYNICTLGRSIVKAV